MINSLESIDYSVLTRSNQDVSKGDFGTVGIVGGNIGMHGALVLAGIGALYSGSGKVILYSLDASFNNNYLELLHKDYIEVLEDLDKLTAVVIGPGLGLNTKAISIMTNLLDICPSDKPLLIDADGLNILAYNKLAHKLERYTNVILTPHPGEAARLLNSSVAEVQLNRLTAINKLGEIYNAVIILKGSGSLIKYQHSVYLNQTGNPILASSGNGDVLSGLIASLVAQKMTSLNAARLGVYLHGLAADSYAKDIAHGCHGFLASEIVLEVRRQLNMLLSND